MRATSHVLLPLFLACAAEAQLVVPSPAYPKIQQAIDAAAANATITVLPGTYYENLDLKGKALTLTGIGGAAATIIDGGAAAPVIKIVTAETRATMIQGFTIRNGKNTSTSPISNGGGINMVGSSPTILDCVFTGNVGAGYGGGIGGSPSTANPCSPLIRDCKFIANFAQGASYASGAGLAVANGSAGLVSYPEIRRCEFRDNVATQRGGGVYFSYYSNGLVEDCFFTGNQTTATGTGIEGGAALYTSIYSNAIVRNNVIVGNSSGGNGGGVKYFAAAGAVFVNNTIFGNTNGGVAGFSNSATVTLATFTNCIIWGNGPTEFAFTNTGTNVPNAIVSYCDVAGGYTGTGNISAAPLLANPASGNARLLAGSPCVDAGDNAALQLPAQDFEGDPRISGANVDIGADERVAGSLLIHADRASISLASPGTTTLAIAGGPPRAGYTYVMLASLAGTSPGIDLFGKHLPLNLDALSSVCPSIPTFVGLLGAGGNGSAVLALGSAPLSPALTGLDASFAAGTFLGLAFDAFSNPERVRLVP